MRLPSQSLLRPGPPPDDLLMVVRGGTRTLSDAHLTNQVADCWERHQFFGVSVSGRRAMTWLRSADRYAPSVSARWYVSRGVEPSVPLASR